MNRLAALAALGLMALGFIARPGRAGALGSARLLVDLVDAPRGLVHVVETLDAGPGPLTLTYPRWIPGEHAPNAPIADLAGLGFEARLAGGRSRVVPWTRDPLDLFAFTVVSNVPPTPPAKSIVSNAGDGGMFVSTNWIL